MNCKEQIMIPKIIHCCWFGEKKKKPLHKMCIRSWMKICPDYEIIEWNESNYDINKFKFSKEAYEQEKYGFVVDPIRLDIIYQFGGIYLDYDVQLIQSLNDFLKYDAFFSFQKNYAKNAKIDIALGLGFGAIKKSNIILNYLQLYNDISFNMIASPDREHGILEKYGLKYEDNTQILDNNICVLNSDVMCPISWKDKKINIKHDTHSIHWFTKNW